MKTTVLLLLAVLSFSRNFCELKEWRDWKMKYNKHYASESEEDYRYEIWRNTYETVMTHNEDESRTFTMGMNKFSDLTHDEYRSMLGLHRFNSRSEFPTTICSDIDNEFRPHHRQAYSFFNNGQTYNGLPMVVDWRSAGAVTPVKDQGMCGSCWAFSATETLESYNKLYGDGNLHVLSEQQLVDCSFAEGDYGCGGGLMDYAFNYTKLHGACSEADYPYTGQDDSCVDTQCTPVVHTVGCANIWSGDTGVTESTLNYWLTMHPVAVAVDAGSCWMNYQSGVINSTDCYHGLDHGVSVVGYNRSSDGSGYWIVRNSWGTDWGVDGYVYVAMDSNICGIAEVPSFPLM